jgi:hypothetical protein
MVTNTAAPPSARSPRYVKAEEALPPDLLAAIQEHVECVYVWIPSRLTERRRIRDAEIFQRRAAGESIHQVALAMGLTARRVCQIQQRARRQSRDAAAEGAA